MDSSYVVFFFSSRRRHTRLQGDWSSDVCSSDLLKLRYGRHTLGQSCLLARRLVEAGVSFVTVTDGGWDTHQNNFKRSEERRVGEEGRSRGAPDHLKKKKKKKK